MGFSSFTQEFNSPNIAPSRFFRALILDSSNLIPNLLPQFISSIHVLEGNGGPGTIEQINFTKESGFKYVKHRIDEVDEENLTCKYTTIEGHPLADKVESVVFAIELGATSSGGCVCKMTSSYTTKANMSIGEEEEIKAGEDGAVAIYRVVEAYLLDNPEAYA